MSKLFEEFQDYLNKMNQYEHVITLLYWDMKTVTPKLGQAGHVDALTHFSSEHFAMSTSERLGEMLAGLAEPAEFEELTDTWQYIVKYMKKEYNYQMLETGLGIPIYNLNQFAISIVLMK